MAASAHVFPDNLYFPSLATDDATLSGWVDKYLLQPSPIPNPATPLPHPKKLNTATVLICSHSSRDQRCGAYYPPLREEFENVFRRKGLGGEVKIAATSHLSGHKFAGNVVVYLPEGWGVWYGRVGVGQVEGIVGETIVKGRVVGELARGVVGRELEVL